MTHLFNRIFLPVLHVRVIQVLQDLPRLELVLLAHIDLDGPGQGVVARAQPAEAEDILHTLVLDHEGDVRALQKALGHGEPRLVAGMNKAEKIVFSRTLEKAEWNNTRLVKSDLIAEVRSLKRGSGQDLTILGSGSIVSQLAQEDLIDEYQILLNPVVIGKGKTMFEGVKDRFSLRLIKTRVFGNGNIMLHYEPVR